MLYPQWLNPGDNSWQLTAATLVGLMSVPGLVVLYGGVMQKRWSVNSMMLAFIAFALVLVEWVLYGYKMGFGNPFHGAVALGLLRQLRRPAGQRARPQGARRGRANIPLVGKTRLPVLLARLFPVRLRRRSRRSSCSGSVLGRVNFKAWIPFVVLWGSCVYTINAFLLWGGGWLAQQGRGRLQRRLCHPPRRRASPASSPPG